MYKTKDIETVLAAAESDLRASAGAGFGFDLAAAKRRIEAGIAVGDSYVAGSAAGGTVTVTYVGDGCLRQDIKGGAHDGHSQTAQAQARHLDAMLTVLAVGAAKRGSSMHPGR